MPIYVDIPPDYENRLKDQAYNEDRSYRQQAVALLKWAIDQRDRARKKAHKRQNAEPDHAAP